MVIRLRSLEEYGQSLKRPQFPESTDPNVLRYHSYTWCLLEGEW